MATLQERHVAIKFQGGIETKMDSKTVPAARLLVLENGVFTKGASVKKRNGYEAYSKFIEASSGPRVEISDAVRLGVREENELLLYTRKRAYSHQTGDTDQWSDTGQVFCAHGEDRAVVHTGTNQTQPDHASNGGVSVYAWVDSRGGVYYTVIDQASGRVHVEPRWVGITSSRHPRCVAVGPNIHVYYTATAENRIYVLVVDPSNPVLEPTPAILVNDLNTNDVFDACPTTRTGLPALIAWHEFATDNFRIGYVDSSGVLGSPLTGHPSVARFVGATDMQALRADTPLAVAYEHVDGGDNDRLSVALTNTRNTTTGAAFRISGGTTAISIGSTIFDEIWSGHTFGEPQVDRCAVAIIDNTIWAVFEDTNDGPSKRVARISKIIPTDTFGASQNLELRSVTLMSRAFVVDGEAFVYFAHDTTYFNVFLGVCISSPFTDFDGNHRFQCVARQSPGGAGGIADSKHVSSAHVSGYQVATCLPHIVRLESEDSDQFGETGLRNYTLDFNSENSHQYAQLGHGLYVGAACPQHYDGRQWCEAGFHVGPEDIVADSTFETDGGLTASGTYLYIAWYEYTDAQGEIHRGPVSIGTEVSMGQTLGEVPDSHDTVTLDLPTYRVTTKERVRICVGRTVAGDASRFFRVTSLDPLTEGADNGYVANDITVDTVEFIDKMSDIDLLKQEPVYTNGGVLSNDPTALGNILVAGKNRLFFNDCSDPNAVRYSQELAEGYGVECPPELVMKTNPKGGRVSALAVMDEFVIVFKESAIYIFNGPGPTVNGDISGGAFSDPDEVSSDVGCTNPSSIVETPLGLMFESAKGIYRLGRDRSVRYIGAPVEAFNGQTVTRATVMPDRSQAVFLTADGTTLLYDFLFDQWSTFKNHLGRDAVIVNGVYHYLRLDDRVFAETIGEYSDAGVRIRLRFETAWVHIWEHLQGLQRFWKLLLLGTWGSPHQLGIQYRTDYDESGWGDPCWLDATGDSSSAGWITGEGANPIGEDLITGAAYGEGGYGEGVFGGENPDLYQWRLGLHCAGQSIQFRFEDFEKTGLAGATFELTEMLITGGVLKPDNRPTRAARSG